MRAYWTGTLQVGLLALPVKMYGTTQAHDTRFRLLHQSCGTPISQVRRCPRCECNLDFSQVIRGAQISKTRFVPITDDDLDALPLPTAGSIVLDGFLPAGEIPALWREKAVYLGPEEGTVRPYALLQRTLAATDQVGIGKVSIRGREHLVAVGDHWPALVLWQLYFADEIKSASEIPFLFDQQAPVFTTAEMDLARQVVEALVLPRGLEDYRDETEDALAVLIGQRVERLPAAAPAEPKIVTADIMEALRESLRLHRAEKEVA